MDREKAETGFELCANGEPCRGEKFTSCPFSPRNNAEQNCGVTMARNALALLKEQKWNVLTEDADGVIHGLPGDDGQYLMTDGKDIWIDDYVDGVDDGVWLDSGRDIREITAWMYMPELPKMDRR